MTNGNRRVMIVEDNLTNMKLAINVLELSNFEVCGVVNAEEALKKIASFDPAVILMDIQLPGIDGLSLTKIIKQKTEYKDIYIIAMTAFAMKGDKEKTLAAGCDEYIAKPADLFDVVTLIENKLAEKSMP